MVVTQYFCIVNLAASVIPELCVYVCVGWGVEQNTVNEYGTLVTQYLYIVNTVVGLIPEWGWGGGGVERSKIM